MQWHVQNRELSDEHVSGEGVHLSLPINESTLKKIFAVLIGIMMQADQRGPITGTRMRGSCYGRVGEREDRQTGLVDGRPPMSGPERR